MSCDCRCCAVGARCARELVLSPKDASDAYRLDVLGGTGGGMRAVVAATQPLRPEPPESTSTVACRTCARPFQVFEYLATFVQQYAVPVRCEVCR